MKIAVYARVSTSDQDCTIQLQALSEFCSRQGWEISREYVDHGISGAKASRPALDELMRDAAAHRFQCVAVHKIDRFGRSVLHLSQQLAELQKLGIRFIATAQGVDTDQSNPASRFFVHILSAAGEFEREMIRERVAAGRAQARRNGVKFGRPARVFRRDEALRLRAEGHSFRTIAKMLGVPVMTVSDAVRKFDAQQPDADAAPEELLTA
jgi:putative DNA-invertase from lambdoid prophage Rac